MRLRVSRASHPTPAGPLAGTMPRTERCKFSGCFPGETSPDARRAALSAALCFPRALPPALQSVKLPESGCAPAVAPHRSGPSWGCLTLPADTSQQCPPAQESHPPPQSNHPRKHHPSALSCPMRRQARNKRSHKSLKFGEDSPSLP